MTTVWLIIGMVILASACFIVGRGGLQPTRKPPPIPMCACGHGLNTHDPQTRHCLSEVGRDRYNYLGTWAGRQYVPCPCVRYIGPIPLDDIWIPELPE